MNNWVRCVVCECKFDVSDTLNPECFFDTFGRRHYICPNCQLEESRNERSRRANRSRDDS